MVEHVRNRKRCGWKSLMLSIVMALTFFFHAGAAPGRKWIFGIQSGWSFSWEDLYEFHHHLGGHIRYAFSDRLGLQFSLVYQNGSHRHSFFSYNLSGFFQFPEWKHLRFYILAGPGLGHGDGFFVDSFFFFSGGAGVKIGLDRKSGLALDLGLSLHHLYHPEIWRSGTLLVNLSRVNVGIEVPLNLHKRRP